MKNKVILISIDGMRPDGFLQCGNPFSNTMQTQGAYTLNAKTVFPPITLPCHTSLFHSVPPQRHGVLNNTYAPPVHPVDSLFTQIKNAGGKSAMFYGWEHLRDVARPGILVESRFLKALAFDDTDRILTESALDCIARHSPDFVFLYLVETDEKGGHDNGWMTKAYLDYISVAVDCVKRVLDEAGEGYHVIVTADHGGHDRMHGVDCPEDMTIPMFFFGNAFQKGERMENVSILDLAPTIADLLGILPAEEWEGKSLLKGN